MIISFGLFYVKICRGYLISKFYKVRISIANKYEVPCSQNLVKSLIAALTGGVLSATTATSISSLVKVVPFIGQAAFSTAF